MKYALVALLLLSCGDNKEDVSDSAFEVTKLNMQLGGNCGPGLTINPLYSNGLNGLEPPLYAVASYSTSEFPEKCDSKSYSNQTGYHVCIPDINKLNVTYFIRVCVFNAAKSAYSHGLTGTFMEPSS